MDIVNFVVKRVVPKEEEREAVRILVDIGPQLVDLKSNLEKLQQGRMTPMEMYNTLHVTRKLEKASKLFGFFSVNDMATYIDMFGIFSLMQE